MTRRRWLMMGVVAALMTAPALAQEGPKTSPEQAAKFVETLSKEALAVLRADSAALELREAKVRELLSKNFDLERIGKFVLGKAWPEATPAQRAEYLQLFSEYVLATYSRRLGGYSGESFKIVKAETVGKQDAIVMTEIARPSGSPLNCGWRVRTMEDGKQKILDVVVDGLSMINTQRDEFAAVVQKRGMDGLLETLRLQTTRYAAQKS